ncbi:DUF402 domain-containing protein [Corynebacterium uropygiale]|uniref:DUF402 domain-containing protein n=1 Tax=Corynebacterium uropygiale TaxID=1775911 RepID=A0A9X1QPQ8_9CORY|nr:DUF402 domain-containing protein [Corynebacterium uropygiale]MCF4006881.1 DUF402 domain-containing protein [Corynebacterium uropygiale]
MVDLHPVKEELFDIPARLNIDPKGFHRAVDTYERTDFGLYMGRGADHPRFGYLESWLLPALSLRINIFHFRPHVTTGQLYYCDVAEIIDDGERMRTRDLYIDLVTHRDKDLEVLDIDELAAATAAGLLSPADAERAIEATLHAVEGITRAGDDLMAWLRAEGYPLTWADSVTLQPAG